jgi:hypothetical protein
MGELDDCVYFSIYTLTYTNFYSFCNNGTEFKSALLKLAKQHGIPIITSQAYHLQTQGSVEKANEIFKTRLLAC